MKTVNRFFKKTFVLCVCFAVVCASGCAASGKKSERKLKVLTETAYKGNVEEAASYMMQKNPEIEIEIEYIPTREEERDNRIEKLRTQIMAGKGPDVYLLDNIKADTVETPTPLFENPYKTVQSGALASLDRYMKQDAYWKNSTYKKEFLKAGQYEGRQYIIPLSCACEFLVSEDDDIGYLSDMDLEQWYEEAKTSDNTYLKDLMGGRNMVAGSWIKEAADYENKEIYFDREKWERFYMNYTGRTNTGMAGSLQLGDLIDIKAAEAVPDLMGKKIAAVQAFGAVGMSSDYKEDAYQFLMLFLNDEMKAEAEEQGLGTQVDGCIDGEMPVQESTFTEWAEEMGYDGGESQLLLEAFRELEGACFQTKTEKLLNMEVYEQTLRSEDPRIDVSAWEANAEQLAQKAWDSYQMQVNE